MEERAFYYVAKSPGGERVAGRVRAPSRLEALRKLSGPPRNLTVLALSAGSVVGSLETLWHRALHGYHGLRLGPARLTFFRAMAMFEKNGVLVQRALGLCMASCANPRLREALRSVLADVADHGMPLHRAMAERGGEFTPLQVAMVKAGEGGAGFALVLERIARLEERGKRVSGKVQRALHYPAAVALGVVGFLIYVVTTFVPQFAHIAAQFGEQTPRDLQRLTQVGLFFASPSASTLLLALALAGIFTWRLLQANSGFGYWCDAQLYRLPPISSVRRKTALATMSRLLGAMVFAGVPYDQGLELLADAVASPLYRTAIAEIRADIRANGGTFSAAAAKTGLFDPDYLALIAAGEESTSSAEMFDTIATDYDADVERELDTLTTFIEPALIGALGMVVLTIVGIVYGSLYKMISHIR